jgi:predicted 3-demethylubiquinone-9 3-methyltransferase (glyoxalase superfamily)
MQNSIYPCLWFDGQAKTAADFYCSIFRNSKITVDTSLVVNFELNGQKFMGLNGGPMFKLNQSISFFVACKSKEETNEMWSKLFEGGKALMPIDSYPWSERYGWLEDKFGLTWQISLTDKDDAKLQITPSLLFTGNNFGRANEAINLYKSVFRNSSVTALSHYPEAEYGPGKVLFSQFKLKDNDFIIMDGPGNHAFTFNEAVSLVVDCETQKDIDYFWDKLIGNGGQASRCGWLKDKFGVSWQIIPAILGNLMSNPEKSTRVMNALMPMNKLDIEKLVSA